MNGRVAETDAMADIAERSSFAGPPGDGSASFESQRAMLLAIVARRGPADVLANAEFAVSHEGPDSPWRVNALWLLGTAHVLLGDLDAADATYEAAISSDTAATKMAALAWRACVAMSRGDWDAAGEHTRLAKVELQTGYLDEILPSLIVHAAAARVAIYRGDIGLGRDELVRAQLLRPLATYAAPWFAVKVYLELATAYLAISDPAGARIVVREAEQVVRHRPDLGTLTSELVELQQRLASASSTLAGSSALTKAELRVLPMLPTYLSFPEIGDRLGISRHTVKTQAMSIYGKLEASSRGEAVERAVELGLLEPFYGLGLARRPRSD
jgi:LuxR family maltose regulon positive regulatory protein